MVSQLEPLLDVPKSCRYLIPAQKIINHPHSGTFSANPITMTAGRVAMELFDRQAVENINDMTKIAKKQINEAIKKLMYQLY